MYNPRSMDAWRIETAVAFVAATLLTGMSADDGQDRTPTERRCEPPAALRDGDVAIEFIAHACFRIHAADGTCVMIDPYASRVWLGYDFPSGLEAEAVLVTHPHFDHDAGEFIGRDVTWLEKLPVIREPGEHWVGSIAIRGVRGKHAEPFGKEFGRINTMFVLEIDGVRIAHLGDNGPLTDDNVRELGRVDVLMLAIDGEFHILKADDIDAIRERLQPRVLIPMHYRHDDLEEREDRPVDLGPIDPWLAGQQNVRRDDDHVVVLRADTLPDEPQIRILRHSPAVVPARAGSNE